jgi:hypothetical protein
MKRGRDYAVSISTKARKARPGTGWLNLWRGDGANGREKGMLKSALVGGREGAGFEAFLEGAEHVVKAFLEGVLLVVGVRAEGHAFGNVFL